MNPKYNVEKNKDLDQGWAWVIMIAASFAGVLNGMLIYAAGVIHVALLQQYEQDNAYTSLIGSIFTSLLSLIGPFSSMLINMFSCRVAMIVGGITMFVGFASSYFAANNLNYIIVTYGIIAGTGLGFSATPPLVVIGYFFHLKRGLALAVVVSGAGVGMFISGPLVQALINEYGLQGAFLILAGIASNQIVIGALMRPSDLEFRHKKDVKVKQRMEMLASKSNNNIAYTLKNILHVDILFDKAFMFCSLQYFIWNIPYAILLLHLTNYAVSQGSVEEDAALLITYIGIGSTFGRIITGLSIGHNGLDPVLLNFGFNGLAGLLTIFFPLYSTTFKGQTTYSIVFGIYSGGLATMINPLCMELIGVAKVASGIGTMYFIGGVGYLIGPPLAGFIVDRGGTYEDGFYLSGGLFLMAAVFSLISSNWRATSENPKEVIVSLDSLHEHTLISQKGYLQDLNISVEIISSGICNKVATTECHDKYIAEKASDNLNEKDKTDEYTPLTSYKSDDIRLENGNIKLSDVQALDEQMECSSST